MSQGRLNPKQRTQHSYDLVASMNDATVQRVSPEEVAYRVWEREAAARVVDAYCAGDSLVRAMLGLEAVAS